MIDGIHVTHVVAIAENGVIGAEGGLPWRLSSDLKRFKRDTMGKPIVMGRKTFDTIGKPLPGRGNIVVTRQPDFAPDGIIVVPSIDSALEQAVALAKSGGVDEICIIGGGELYRQTLGNADRLYVTHVMAAPEGDTFYPEIEAAEWRPSHREPVPAGEKDDVETLYVIYEHIPKVSESVA
jgi:dihydrofolate reductase